MINKKHIIIISVVLLIIGFALSLSYDFEKIIQRNDGYVLYPEDFINGHNTLSARVLKKDEPTVNTFTAYIDGSDIEDIGNDSLHLLIFRLNGQAYSVTFNDVHIASYGDMSKARSHIYNSLNNFSIPKTLIQEKNTLSIKINSLYMVGLEQSPIGIVGSKPARLISENMGFRTEGLTFIGIGVFLLGIIITIMMIYLSEKKNISLIYFMAAILFLVIYSLDYMHFSQLVIPYIWFKKLIIFALFACIFFLGISFSKLIDSKFSVIFSSTQFALIVIAIILFSDMVMFKRIYDIMIPLISINFIIWIVVAIKNLKEKDEAIIFLCAFINLLIISLVDGLLMVITGGTVTTSAIAFVLVFAMILIALLYLEINRRNLAIEYETRQRSHFYKQAITDPLTGAFNLKHTLNVLSLEIPPYSLVMLDIDDFKEVNDRYGHQAGDFILKHLVKKMQDEFRDTDLVARYGGDEFIVLLRGCSEKNAFEIMNRFRAHIEREKLHYGSDIINTTLSIGIGHCSLPEEDPAHIIKNADEALYRAKHNGKNQVFV